MDTKRLYLNGRWAEPAAPIEVANPANGQLLARVATVNRQGVAQALSDAQQAYDQTIGRFPSEDRPSCSGNAKSGTRQNESVTRLRGSKEMLFFVFSTVLLLAGGVAWLLAAERERDILGGGYVMAVST